MRRRCSPAMDMSIAAIRADLRGENPTFGSNGIGASATTPVSQTDCRTDRARGEADALTAIAYTTAREPAPTAHVNDRIAGTWRLYERHRQRRNRLRCHQRNFAGNRRPHTCPTGHWWVVALPALSPRRRARRAPVDMRQSWSGRNTPPSRAVSRCKWCL